MQHDASDRRSGTGRLIFLIGPSGSGKDSLIDASRERLAAAGVEIARRVITRSAEAKGEAAHGVTPEQFETLRAQGAFAMHWHANGLDYGIAQQVDEWMAAGRAVLVNGSRAYLAEARQRYPNLLALQCMCWTTRQPWRQRSQPCSGCFAMKGFCHRSSSARKGLREKARQVHDKRQHAG